MTKRDAMKQFREIKNSIFLGSTFLVALIFCSVTFATANTYPTDGWHRSTPEKQGMQSQTLANMIEEVEMTDTDIVYDSWRPGSPFKAVSEVPIGTCKANDEH